MLAPHDVLAARHVRRVGEATVGGRLVLVEVERGWRTLKHTLDLRRCLRECPDLKSVGVALVETEPPTLRVRLTGKN